MSEVIASADRDPKRDEAKPSQDSPYLEHTLHYQREHDRGDCPSEAEEGLQRLPSIQPEMAPMTMSKVDDIGPAPDGGLKAWLCILGAFCSCFCVFGLCESSGAQID